MLDKGIFSSWFDVTFPPVSSNNHDMLEKQNKMMNRVNLFYANNNTKLTTIVDWHLWQYYFNISNGSKWKSWEMTKHEISECSSSFYWFVASLIACTYIRRNIKFMMCYWFEIEYISSKTCSHIFCYHHVLSIIDVG